MTSLRSMCAVAALAALVITPVQLFAAATEQRAPGVYVVPVPHDGKGPSVPKVPLIKLSPNWPGGACAFNFG